MVMRKMVVGVRRSETGTRKYEGLVAKDEFSLYIGGRTLSWVKVKQREYRVGSRGFQARGAASLSIISARGANVRRRRKFCWDSLRIAG